MDEHEMEEFDATISYGEEQEKTAHPYYKDSDGRLYVIAWYGGYYIPVVVYAPDNLRPGYIMRASDSLRLAVKHLEPVTGFTLKVRTNTTCPSWPSMH